MLANVGLQSVRCPSHGHISKTIQDRPVVTVKQSTEFITADSVAALRSSQGAPWIYSASNTKYVRILIRPSVRLKHVKPQLL